MSRATEALVSSLFDPSNAEAVAAGREQGGAATFERGKGLWDPANAEAVAAARKQAVKTCNKAQGRAYGKPLGSCAGCEVDQEETLAVRRWGSNGVPVCNRHYYRWNNWKRAGKHALLADALRKAKAMHLASDSDSDVRLWPATATVTRDCGRLVAC